MSSGSDFLALSAADVPDRGKAVWLAGRLRGAVADGTLRAGTVLPPTRVWAAELGVSRGVIVEACRQLGDEGLLTSRVGSGAVITARPVDTGRVRQHHVPPAQQATFDLSPGMPDLSAFPRAAWLRAERAVLDEVDHRELGYGDPKGSVRLRDALADRLVRLRGVHADPDQIVVTAGVAQGLALLCRVMPSHEVRTLALEDPGSAGIREHLAAWGYRPTPVAVDEYGLDVARLAATDADAVVVTPAHQFPTGVVLSGQRRRALLDWARAGGAIIEDDYDAEHRYDRPPTTALHPSLPRKIAYLGSVSKTLSPALRIGWLIPPPHLLDEIVSAKHAFDIATPGLSQLVLARLMSDTTLDRFTRSVRRRQRQRRDALIAALRSFVPAAQIHGVAAGLHLLITLPDTQDDKALVDAISELGVTVHPLSKHRVGPGPAGIVIGYASHTPDQLTDAARRIARAWH